MIKTKLKKLCIPILCGSLCGGMLASAADIGNLTVDKIGIDGSLVTVNVSYGGDERITLRANKNGGELSLKKSTYAVLQERAHDGKAIFEFEIPDQKNGEASTGEYTVYLRAGENPAVTETFVYVSATDVLEFINKIKIADNAVSGSGKDEIIASAAEKYSALFSEENKTVLEVLGIDLTLFNTLDASVQNQVYYLIHTGKVANADTEQAKELFKAAFALSVYENGDKTQAVLIMDPDLEDAEAKTIGAYMSGNFESAAKFAEKFNLASELYKINNARVGTLPDLLENFSENETIKDIMTKINKLQPSKQNTVYDFVVTSTAKTPVKSENELNELLKKAYNKATEKSQSGGVSGGGGGGSFGGGSVSVPVHVSNPEPDTKTEVSASGIFNDVSDSHWAFESIKYLHEVKAANGDGNGGFAPDRFVTREEFLKMIMTAAGIEPAEGSTKFRDVENGAWYEGFVAAAAEKEIVNGVTEEYFGTGTNITREDIAVISHRITKLLGKECEKVREYTSFADESEISDYALESVKTLNEASVLNGRDNGYFAPKAFATRAETAKIIYEIFGRRE